MSRLLLVSNRLPVTVTRSAGGVSVEGSAGGLVAGLRKLHDRGDSLWVGWPGCETQDGNERLALDHQLSALRAVPVHLSSDEVKRYYGDFSNGVLWPLLHFSTGLLPLEMKGWEEYRAVNARFADTVAAHYRAGDFIWIHDYQLLLLPLLLRNRFPDATIGFFLHTPFPPADLFGILPHREELLKGLLGADLIGFHTASYGRHFESAVERYLGKPTAEGALSFRGRSVRTGVFPIGVDAEDHECRAAQLATKERVKAIRGDGSQSLLVGIDRLDHTKGIPRRLLSFQELLTRRPEWRGRMRLIQIAVPSRGDVGAYQTLRHEVENLVGQINGTFGTTEWSPVQYLCRGVDRDEVTALYGAADVMLVTPVRDGMNLVAKEFVASRIDGDGVLVLSEFAGAAAELQDAVVVNPYDISACADAFHRAMTMPRPERRARMQALRESVTRYDVSRWTECFLRELSPAATPPRPRRSKRILASALLTKGFRLAWRPIAERLRSYGVVTPATRRNRPATVPQLIANVAPAATSDGRGSLRKALAADGGR